MQITITDEGTRRAVRFALWDRVHNDLGDGTSAFYDQSRAAITDEQEDKNEVVDLMAETFRDVERVQSAALGDAIDLEIKEDELREGLANCSSYIVEDEGFWVVDRRAQRPLVLATFDAAQAILAAEREPVA